MAEHQPAESPLFGAIKARDSALALRLLAAGRERRAKRRLTPLTPEEIRTISNDDVSRLRQLLDDGLDPGSLMLAGHKDIYLLSVALARGYSPMVCTLLEYGADVHCLHDVHEGRLPTIHVAIAAGLGDIVWLLLIDGADPDSLGERYSALFRAAARFESPDVAKMLLDAGAKVDLGLGSETPLMAAAEKGRAATVDLLLARGADVNASSPSGWTALHHAAWSEHPQIARKLLDAGADPLAVDAHGRNATHHATSTFDPIYAEVFRQWGIPDDYSPQPVEDDWEPGADFDFFISYRHGRFAQVASSLAEALRAVGLTPFLDRDLLDLPTTGPSATAVIKTRLLKALRRSRTTVFFESYREVTDSPDFSWQFFELLNSREALLISMDKGWAEKWITTPGKRVSTSDVIFVFSNVTELAGILAARSWA